MTSQPTAPVIGPPLWLLAEVTYRCPLHCVFCYNPTQHAHLSNELSTAQWVDVMRQARALGGDVRIDGGLNVGAKAASSTLRIQGSASAEGLRAATELGVVTRLAQYATGTATFAATVGLRGGTPEVLVTSNLVGMALALPAPMAKAPWPRSARSSPTWC